MLLTRLTSLPQPFTRADAAAVGISRHQLDREVRRGVATRLHRGLYAATDGWDALAPWERLPGLALAAFRAHPDAVVSHLSAAALHGLVLPAKVRELAVITVDDDSTTARHPWIDLRRGALPAADVTRFGEVPVTAARRTVVDCFRSQRLADAVAMADDALRRGVCTHGELLTVRREQRRWPGITAADRGFDLVDARRDSWFESTSAVVLHGWGMPVGVPQVDVLDAGGTWLARVDVAWPSLGVVGEADGRGKFLGAPTLGLTDEPAAVARRLTASHDRAEALRATGLQVVRWTPAEVWGAPLALVARWRGAVDAAARSRHRAALRCRCCGLDATDCEFVRFPGLRRGASTGRTGKKWEYRGGQVRGEMIA